MITFFSFPRPFKREFDIIQNNGIKSWLFSTPKAEIILFEDEEGTTKNVAESLGAKYVPEVKCNEFGTPILSDIIAKAQNQAQGDVLICINPDILLLTDLEKVVDRVKQKFQDFLIVGRRWDLDVKNSIEFIKSDWQRKLREERLKNGKLHRMSGMDYWIFPKHIQFNHPPFTNGRFATDGWLVYEARRRKIPVIDATEIVEIIHQNHYYPQKEKDYYEIERKRNLELAGGLANVLTLRDADWLLTKEGLKRPEFPRRIFPMLSLNPVWRTLLILKRNLSTR